MLILIHANTLSLYTSVFTFFSIESVPLPITRSTPRAVFVYANSKLVVCEFSLFLFFFPFLVLPLLPVLPFLHFLPLHQISSRLSLVEPHVVYVYVYVADIPRSQARKRDTTSA